MSDDIGEMLFVPEIMLPNQWADLAKSRYRTPEQRLVLAVLEDAVSCFKDRRNTRNANRRRAEATAWLIWDYESDAWSLSQVCEWLDIDLGELRRGLLAWRAAHPEGESVLSPRQEYERAYYARKKAEKFAAKSVAVGA